jgi:hypothetical protein
MVKNLSSCVHAPGVLEEIFDEQIGLRDGQEYKREKIAKPQNVLLRSNLAINQSKVIEKNRDEGDTDVDKSIPENRELIGWGVEQLEGSKQPHRDHEAITEK